MYTFKGMFRLAGTNVRGREGASRAARWAPISSGEPRAAALHLYDNYFLFVFVEESVRLADRRTLLRTNYYCGKLKPPGPLPRREIIRQDAAYY